MSDPRREILEALAADDITVGEALAALDINDRIQEPGTFGALYRVGDKAETLQPIAVNGEPPWPAEVVRREAGDKAEAPPKPKRIDWSDVVVDEGDEATW